MPRSQLTSVLVLGAIVLSMGTAEAADVTLRWTAPGDDGMVGQASEYAMRYSQTAIGADTLSWWNAATPVSALLSPSPAGERDSVNVALPPGSYYFLLITADEVPNWSGWSNVASVFVPEPPDTQPPARVLDLEAVVYPNPTSTGQFFRETELEVRE